jgi:fatty-acyl-CoA synthase
MTQLTSSGPSPDDFALPQTPANHVPLSPLSFLKRIASVFPDHTAIVHGQRRISYGQFHERVGRFASALSGWGVEKGDVVAIMAPNVPALLEAHYAVPLAGGVLLAINTRLDAATVKFILGHSGAKIVLIDHELNPVMAEALAEMEAKPRVIDIADAAVPDGANIGEIEYESFLERGDPSQPWDLPTDEWQPIALNYTSGTTGNPKGALYSHRGAYLNAIGNVLAFQLNRSSVYLWTLPMFHCNGWTYTWAVTLAGGTHVCLRKVDPADIFRLIADEKVTHMCGAPIVLNMLIHAPAETKVPFDQTVEIATGGAAPPSAVISGMEKMGFRVTHLYGLTETYGPATICEAQDHWSALSLEDRASQMARQGVGHPTLEEHDVRDPETLEPVPRDGQTMGEIMIRSNTVMMGYLANPDATDSAFAGGWYHSGDLGVIHPDGYIEIKDRSKDIIISGGENISSLEVEEVLFKHPKIMEAAVVARPDDKWGETPCAFVVPVPGETLSADDVMDWCRANLASFKVPRHIVFGELPKTATGKIQKFVLRDMAKEED